VLRARPHLRPCLTRCCHCGILFLTHPRNAGREDLGCPFGCREAHRRKASSERSVEYYRTPAGRQKRKALNGKRGGKGGMPAVPAAEEAAAAAPGETGVDTTVVEHVRVVLSLVEGFPVSREEVLEVLGRTSRQRRMWQESRTDYVVRRLAGHPP
jgi:hypothetical protein